MGPPRGKKGKKGKGKKKSGSKQGGGGGGGGSAGFGTQTVWRAGVDPLEDGEELTYDPTAYECLHRFRFAWPCLSFDIARDALGQREKTQFPYECTVVAGTQANDPNENALYIARLSNVSQGKHGPKREKKDKKADDGENEDMEMDSDPDSDSDSEDESDQPYFSAVGVHHRGGINRVRCIKQEGACVVATWGDTGHVQVWDLSSHMKLLSEEKIGPRTQKNKVKQVHQTPLHIVSQHPAEGYAMAWSGGHHGKFSLLTGDCKGQILLTRHDGTLVNWSTDREPFAGHADSVEDLQWSPGEETVFASCSVDKTVKIWDTRQRQKPGLSFHAHDADVNVISWNPLTTCMIASGGDDGTLRIWDMRFISNGKYVANFDYCKKAITSLEWSPWEGSMIATTSADNQICFWDLSVERDADEEMDVVAAARAEEGAAGADVDIPADIPPQLLFVHQGQENIKEVHWHEQIKGACVSTAYDGFNLFSPSNL